MRLNGSITRATFINDLVNRSADLVGLGYFPGNFGWITMVLTSSKVSPYFIDSYNDKFYYFEKPLRSLKNRFVLVSRPDFPLRALSITRSRTQEFLGVVRISPTGDGFQVMWGFFRQTIEAEKLYQQLFVLNEAVQQNSQNSLVVYTSPTYLQSFSYFGSESDDFQFTYDLWASFPELVKITSSGIGITDMFLHPGGEFLTLIQPKLQKYNVNVVKGQGAILFASSWNEIMALATILDRSAQSALTIQDLKNQVSGEILEELSENKLSPEMTEWLQAKEEE